MSQSPRRSLAVVLFSVGSALPAQFTYTDQVGSPIDVHGSGFARLEGWALEWWGINGRHVWNVVSQVGDAYATFRPIAAQTSFENKSAESIDLERGYAYLKVTDLRSELTEIQIVLTWLGNPAVYGAAVVERLRETKHASAETAPQLSLALARAGRKAAATPWITKAVRFPLSGPASWGERIDEAALARWQALAKAKELEPLLAELLNERTPHVELVAVHVVRLLARADAPGLSGLLARLRFPIVLSHRTAAGAEGTEVVAYVQEISATEAKIYYFYLSTDHDTADVDIATYWLNGSLETTDVYQSITEGQYAWVAVKQTDYNGEPRWFRTGSSGPLPIDTSLPADLQAMLVKAFADANQAGIQPTPCPCGGLNLQ